MLQADLYNKLSQSKVIQEAALRSGIAKGAINAAWDAIGQPCIIAAPFFVPFLRKSVLEIRKVRFLFGYVRRIE